MSILRDKSKLQHILNIFPVREQIKYCFAYGSAVFEQKLENETPSSEQKNSKPQNRMIDLVVAVENPFEFHRENLLKNRSHYSSLKHLGAKTISQIQQHFGARIFYNTLVPLDGDYIKYGIISRNDLVGDLLDWNSFYISGRLHKPTVTLKKSVDDTELTTAIKMNVQSAVHVALLLLPEKFSELEFYLTIAGLSYAGDFRMSFGEDKNKVEKIVKPQMDHFRAMYNPLLASDQFSNLVQWKSEDGQGQFVQNCSSNAIQWHLCLLPKNVQHYLRLEWITANATSPRQKIAASRLDIDDLMQRLAGDITYRSYLKSSIERIVFRSSATQSFKGLFTAGLAKSITYSWEKVNKMLKSLQK